MKLQIPRETLLAAVTPAAAATESRGTLPILTCLLIKHVGQAIHITGSDLETQIRARIPADPSDEPGAVCLPAKKLLDILRLAPDGSPVTLKAESPDRVRLQVGKSRYTLASQPAENYPIFDQGDVQQTVTLPAESLLSGLRRVAFAMAQQDVRYYLNGLGLRLESGHLVTVASDGHRLAVQRTVLTDAPEPSASPSDPLRILPRNAVLELIKLLTHAVKGAPNRLVTLRLGERTASVDLIGTEATGEEFSTKLIEGRYPDIQRVIPTDPPTRVRVQADAMVATLNRAMVLNDNPGYPVALDFDEERLSITATNAEAENAEETLDISLDGPPLALGFNGRYLCDALAMCDDDAELGLSHNSCLVTSPAHDGWQAVVMPMRL
jgi:DNA polymerase-3 subunit beta